MQQLVFPIKVVVLHEDALMSAGVASTLATQPDMEVVRLPTMDTDADAIQADVLVADFGTALTFLLARQRAPQAPRGISRTPMPSARRRPRRSSGSSIDHSTARQAAQVPTPSTH